MLNLNPKAFGHSVVSSSSVEHLAGCLKALHEGAFMRGTSFPLWRVRFSLMLKLDVKIGAIAPEKRVPPFV